MPRIPFFARALLVAAATTACQTSADSTPPAVRRGEFRVMLPAGPATLNPDIDLDEAAFVVARNLFNHLVSVGETGELVPELAERWDSSPDGLAYTFYLRRGVTWHDGAPFSSEDVRWTLEKIAADGIARDVMAPVASVETPDSATVVVRLKYAWAPFASDVGSYGMSILPKHVYGAADWRKHPANQRPIGTGPFKFRERRADGAVVLDANTRYFRPGPFVERVVFLVGDPAAASSAMAEDRVDYTLVRPPQSDLDRLAGNPLVRVRRLPSTARLYCVLNHRVPRFGDVRVRRALANAIDRLTLIQEALRGNGSPAIGWYTPAVEWAYNVNARVPDFDPRAAERLLDEAGYPRRAGVRFRSRLVVPDLSPVPEVARELSRQWERIGVAVAVEQIPIAEVPRRVVLRAEFEMALIAGGQGPDPDQLRRRFAPPAAAYIGYQSEAFREAVDRGARATTLVERAREYYRAQEILAADVPFIPLSENVRITIYNARVRGLPQLEAQGLVGATDFSLVRLDAGAAGDTR